MLGASSITIRLSKVHKNPKIEISKEGKIIKKLISQKIYVVKVTKNIVDKSINCLWVTVLI